MAMCLGDSLLVHGGLHPVDLRLRFLNWVRAPWFPRPSHPRLRSWPLAVAVRLPQRLWLRSRSVSVLTQAITPTGRTQSAHSAAEAWALAATSPHRWMSSKRSSGPSPRLATCERAAAVRAAERAERALAVTPLATAPSCGWAPCLRPTAAAPSWRRRWRTGRAARRTAAKRRPVC
jgi:hypothetical protein